MPYESDAAVVDEVFNNAIGNERATAILEEASSDGVVVIQNVLVLTDEAVAEMTSSGTEVVNFVGGGTFDLSVLPSTVQVVVFSEPVIINGTTFQSGTYLLGSGNDLVNFGNAPSADQAAPGVTIDPGAGSNTVVATSGADTVWAGAGSKNTVEGGAGVDIIEINGRMADFALQVSGSTVMADNAASGTDLDATNSEIFMFDDGVVFNAANTTEAAVARMYEVILDRSPDAAGMKGWTEAIRSGAITVVDAAFGFTQSAEAIALGMTGTTNEQFLDDLYANAFGRAADDAGKAGWLDLMNQGMTREQVTVGFAASVEAEIVITGVNVISGSI